MSDDKKLSPSKPGSFFKPTISLPEDLQPFVEQRKNEPQHAGNLSSYIRFLIISDRNNKPS